LAGTGIFSLHHHIQMLCGPPSLLSQGVKLTIHFYLVPKLRICGAITPLLHTSSWYGVGLSRGYVMV